MTVHSLEIDNPNSTENQLTQYANKNYKNYWHAHATETLSMDSVYYIILFLLYIVSYGYIKNCRYCQSYWQLS